MVIISHDASAAEACSAGHAQERIKFGLCEQPRVVCFCCTVSCRANDTWWQRHTIDVNPGTTDVNPDDCAKAFHAIH